MPTATEIEAVKQAYLDNADYAESNSLTKAKAFATACRKLLMVFPNRMRTGGSFGSEIEHDASLIKQELDTVTRWISVAVGITPR